MFSPTSSTSEYNFDSDENSYKWKGTFKQALKQVQRQVGPSTLTARDDALEYVESLILQLLGMLCNSQPHSVTDVEERVTEKFPHPIDKWAIGEAQHAIDAPIKKKKSILVLPVDKIHPLLVKDVLGYKIDFHVTLYIVAVLEYIAADILKLTGNYVKNMKHEEITSQDIKVAMCADKVLMDMFFQDEDDTSSSVTMEEEPAIHPSNSRTYEDIVKDLLLEENQYMRDLHMIIKVFREPFANLFPRSKDLEVIFSNVMDIHELAAKFISNLEQTLEMTEPKSSPFVGNIFEDMAEAVEFEAYEKYTEDMLKPHSRERLNVLLKRSDVIDSLQAGAGYKDAVKYVLPKLLMCPIYHCLHYFDTIKVLMEVTEDNDRESLEQAYGSLYQTKLSIERKISGVLPKKKPWDVSLRFQGHFGRPQAIARMNELQKTIDGWEGKPIAQNCNEFILDGVLYKVYGKSTKLAERHIFLLDGLLILCKATNKRMSVTGSIGEFRYKEKFVVRKMDVVDLEDREDLKNAFEIHSRDETIILSAKTAEEKNNWMAALISLNTRSMLERMLDTKMAEAEKNTPLRLPDPAVYRFSEEDSEENIIIEDNQEFAESPLIKGATLTKLVERLTYHMYADPKFVKTFLTTYRSLCDPQELLDLLIQRFNIPDPPPSADEDEVSVVDIPVREDLKRFKKEYCKPVQFRVLNVLRHWVDQHYYDFERDSSLLVKLQDFLENAVKGKAMIKWVESITKIINRRTEGQNSEKEVVFSQTPPVLEWHTAKFPEEYNLMTLHPIEIARQVTLLEFDLYKAVKPSELVGSVWTKKEKQKTSPNLLKMIDHSTRFTFWVEKCIVEAENYEERLAVLSRCLEILIVFQELKNFNGVLEIVSALNSAPVYRLEHTLDELNNKLIKALDEANELNADHYKKYTEKLRSINPPCVPFLGKYLTNILHTEEGNPDFLVNRSPGLINFSKRRKVAEITSEIEQYQNTPYSLEAEAYIKEYFEKLDPMAEHESEKQFNEYLYNQSLKIEPRNLKQIQKFPRKTSYTLKSPGIKSSRSTLRQQIANLTTPGLESKQFQFSKFTDEPDADSISTSTTPPTPNTPLTPPHTGGSDNSVFAHVQIGATSDSSINSSMPSDASSIRSLSGTTCIDEEKPPLPPRRPPRELDSPVNRNYPLEPPRLSRTRLKKSSGSPPPLPPKSHVGTFPRANTFSFISRTIENPVTLPRRFSERAAFKAARTLDGASSNVTVNGNPNREKIPKLPPRDYRKPRKTSQ